MSDTLLLEKVTSLLVLILPKLHFANVAEETHWELPLEFQETSC